MLVVDDRLVAPTTHDLMISSHNNNGERSGQIVPFWSSEEPTRQGTKRGIQAGLSDSHPTEHKDGNSTQANSALSTVNTPESVPPLSNVVQSDDLQTTPLLTENEIYQAVFHAASVEQQDQQIRVTPLHNTSPSQSPPDPLPSSPIVDVDVLATLEDSLPYVPPHSDYAIVEDSYKAAYHVEPTKKRKRREGSQQKVNYKELATVGKKKVSTSLPLPGSKVMAVAQWFFPKTVEKQNVTTKAAWIQSKVLQGDDVSFFPMINAKCQTLARQRQSRKRNFAILEDEQGDHIRNSSVYDVSYDKQLLQYDNSPYGFLDQLVRPSPFLMDTKVGQSYMTRAPHLQTITDPPIRMTKASRIGAAYQARVCRRKEDYHDKRNAKYLPMYEAIWDPVLADAAEKEGQDIEGFLGRSMKLVEREMRMKLLHSCGYQVDLATEEYRRLQMFGWEEDISWTRAESSELERQLRSPVMKDFTLIARKMQRSRSECLVQYYRWKSTAPVYQELKKTWRETNHHRGTKDYCVVCGDGGDLLVCDRCDDPYHLGCLKPSLNSIPVGDWFCPRCVPPRNSFAVVSRTTGGSSPLSKWWSQTARVTNGVVVKDDQKANSKDGKASLAKESSVVLGASAGKPKISAVSVSSSPGRDRTRLEAFVSNEQIDSDISVVSEPADV